MPLEYTKDTILALLFAPDRTGPAAPIRGRTRLQKMLFLLQAEYNIDRLLKKHFEFKAYRFGPFSPQVYQDIEFFENVGIVQVSVHDASSSPEASETQTAYGDSLLPGDTENAGETYLEPEFRLTDRGMEFGEKLWNELPEEIKHAFKEVKSACNDVPLSALLRYVYSNHPDFAENSELEQYKF